MTTLAMIQVNIEVMLAIICLAIWILTQVWIKDNRQKFHYIWVIDILTVGLLISDVLALVYRGDVSVQGYYVVRIANFFNFFFLYMMILYMGLFIDTLFDSPKVGKRRILIARVISGITILFIFVNLIVPFVYDFDEQNRYFRKGGWYVNSACLLWAIILLATVVHSHRKDIESSVYWMVMTDIQMPFIASVIQVFIYGIAITNIAIGVTQLLLFLIIFRYQELKIRERDMQLSEYNAKLILTQVQPHFMLNTLSTIQYLCKHDSEAAFETISDFSVYLRNNMEFATTTELISFEKELSHIEKYIAIEQKRFGDRIKVKYDIQVDDFGIPPLSVQPLVENAIKHGISKKRGGGTVEISTWRGVDEIHVIVKDDGVGFDVDKPFSEDRVHLGLSIVKDRLERMCGGDVKITSSENEGTICEVTIPIVFK